MLRSCNDYADAHPKEEPKVEKSASGICSRAHLFRLSLPFGVECARFALAQPAWPSDFGQREECPRTDVQGHLRPLAFFFQEDAESAHE